MHTLHFHPTAPPIFILFSALRDERTVVTIYNFVDYLLLTVPSYQ